MKIRAGLTAFLAAAVFILFFAPTGASGQGSQTGVLEKEIRVLRAEVAALKARLSRLEAVRPTFTTFMPEFSERFHVMHLSGDAGDWQLAQHELLELERLLEVAQFIDPGKGKLMEGFLAGNMSPRTTARPSSGIARPPSRATPTPRPTSASAPEFSVAGNHNDDIARSTAGRAHGQSACPQHQHACRVGGAARPSHLMSAGISRIIPRPINPLALLVMLLPALVARSCA